MRSPIVVGVLLACLMGLGGLWSLAEGREWTDTTGKFKIEAELVSVADGNVQLRKKDGSMISVPLDKLSQEDREFLAAIQQKREPNSSVAQVMPAMRVLDRLEKSLR